MTDHRTLADAVMVELEAVPRLLSLVKALLEVGCEGALHSEPHEVRQCRSHNAEWPRGNATCEWVIEAAAVWLDDGLRPLDPDLSATRALLSAGTRLTPASLAEALCAVHRRYAMRPGYDELHDPYYERAEAHAAAIIAVLERQP